MSNKRPLGTLLGSGIPCLPGLSWWTATTWYNGKGKIQFWRVSREPYMPNWEVIQFTGQNTAPLNHWDPGRTTLSGGWKVGSEKHLVSHSDDDHMLQGATSLVLTPGMATVGPVSAHHCIRRSGGSRQRGLSVSFSDTVLAENYWYAAICSSLMMRVSVSVYQWFQMS